MTSTQLLLGPTSYPVLIEHSARYSDLDPSKRIGRDALVRWFEDARIAVERDAFGADLGSRMRRLLLASVRVDVLAPLRVAGHYRVGLGVTHIGASSFAYSYAVFAEDECVATGESVSVHATEDGPAPLPDAVRSGLEGLRVDGAYGGRPDRDPSRLVRETYPFRLDVRTRFGDLDTNRHINNVALAGWYLDGLAELHLDVLGYPTGGPLDGLSPSSLQVQYLDEVHYPGIYQLRVGVLELDDTTVRYGCGLFDGPRCIGLADAVGAHALGDPSDPGDLGARLEPFRMRSL
ncbi:thioesterase family protein [Pseudonocardia nigra]|uniref:thioesterase family protein n=1 Tax=Pseudonocardia nigra TaxID=1921578 RepID=UPI001C5F8429|nr:thioesterase family protein [Pseudonocardia nigra]